MRFDISPKNYKNIFISSFGAFLCMLLISFLNSIDESNIWLIPPFGAILVLVMAVNDSKLAQPKNIFFGHLITSIVGLIFLNFVPLPLFLIIPFAVGFGVGLMILLNVTHPPAGGNPIIVILGSVSMDYLVSPIITGSIIILIFGVIINRFILKKEYPILK